MNFIKSYEDLMDVRLGDKKQYWYYVILLNPHELSEAGKRLFGNLYCFHLDSGEHVDYFIPGFLNTGRGIVEGIVKFFSRGDIIKIPEYGDVQFFVRDFVDFYKKLEDLSFTNWRYSGECELLLFNMDSEGRIQMNQFASYNLDDIIRNGRNLSSFIRSTINIGMDAKNQRTAKRQLDEIYANMILPDYEDRNLYSSGFSDSMNSFNTWEKMMPVEFQKDNYYFISYSSKDYLTVCRIRERIEDAGVKCWMAPRDIKHGENYAHVIELAIRYASKFVLVLSKDAIWSVWVEKELQRAIHYFQHESSDRICPVWLADEIDLENTPMALTLEGVQITGSLQNGSNYRKLLPSKIKKRLKEQDKFLDAKNQFENNTVRLSDIMDKFKNQISAACTIKKLSKDINSDHIQELRGRLIEQIPVMKACVKELEQFDEIDENSSIVIKRTVGAARELEETIEEITKKIVV